MSLSWASFFPVQAGGHLRTRTGVYQLCSQRPVQDRTRKDGRVFNVRMGMKLSAFSSGIRAKQLDFTPGGRELIINPEEVAPSPRRVHRDLTSHLPQGNQMDVVSSGSPRGTVRRQAGNLVISSACPQPSMAPKCPWIRPRLWVGIAVPVDSDPCPPLQPQTLLLPRPCLLGSSPTMFFHSRPLHPMFLIPG